MVLIRIFFVIRIIIDRILKDCLEVATNDCAHSAPVLLVFIDLFKFQSAINSLLSLIIDLA
jgi:hypothetical protein